MTNRCYRWKNEDGTNKYTVFIPEVQLIREAEDPSEQPEKSTKTTRKVVAGALSHEDDLSVHKFVAHLRRVHATNPDMTSKVDGINQTVVKAADPLAPAKTPLYYYHSKTALYNDFVFRFWDKCMAPLFCYGVPMAWGNY